MKKRALVGIFGALIATFLMSHNAGAVTRLGGLTGFSTNVYNSLDSGLITTFNQNTEYTVNLHTGNFYIANGNFATSINVYANRKNYIAVYVVGNNFSDLSTFRPEKINIVPAGGLSQFGTVNDDVEFSRSCTDELADGSYTCNNTILHTVELSTVADYNGQVRVSGSLIMGNAPYSDTGQISWGALHFDGQDELTAFKSSFTAFAAQNHNDLTAIQGYIDNIESKLDTVNANLDGVETKLNTANGHLNIIEDNTEDIADDVNAIRGSANTSAQKDAQDMQAYENMQNTDGLINIGDQTGALSIVGSINSVLGQIETVPVGASCTILGNLGAVNLGQLDFCQGKDNFGTIVTFVATGIFLFLSFFIVVRVIRRVLRLIAWARSN